MEEAKERAIEELRRLVNGNFGDDLAIEINYESAPSKMDTSLLMARE